jgi:hypothetical protein
LVKTSSEQPQENGHHQQRWPPPANRRESRQCQPELALSWIYTRVLYNFAGAHIASYNATSPALNLYRYERNTVNPGLAYQGRPSVSFSCDVANIFNEKQRIYQGFPGRTQDIVVNFVAITIGLKVQKRPLTPNG